MRAVSHENIVGFKEYHETKNSVYIVYELVDGPDLSHTQVSSFEGIRSIILSLLKAVKHLKTLDLFHGGLTSEAISLPTGDPHRPKINSFCPSLLATGQLDLTWVKPGFLAPEFFKICLKNSGSPYEIFDTKVDVFSIGVIFHYLLFNKWIYDAENDEERMVKNKLNLRCISGFEEMEFGCPSAYNLMLAMLENDPERRIGVEEALKHEFFLDGFIPRSEPRIDFEGEMSVPDDPVPNQVSQIVEKKFFLSEEKKKFIRDMKTSAMGNGGNIGNEMKKTPVVEFGEKRIADISELFDDRSNCDLDLDGSDDVSLSSVSRRAVLE